MPLKPQADWADSYESGLTDYYEAYGDNPALQVITFWQPWIAENCAGLESAAPYTGSAAVITPTAFAPVDFTGVSSAVQAAQVLADAWQAFMTALTWPPTAAVAPPFSVISAIQTSPTGMAAAYTVLLSGLVAEMAALPPDPLTAFALKSAAFATLFRTATLAAGIQLDGLAIGGTPPPPVSVPLSPIM